MVEELELAVSGMTCRSCELTIAEELEDVEGVTDVAVDRQRGRILVRGEGFDADAATAAVIAAGYPAEAV
jgi:copper chaperone